MNLLSVETAIPKYALDIDEATGNRMFRIARHHRAANYYISELLVPHRKDYYLFVYVKEGSSRHWIDMVPYTVKANKFYFTVPHQVHLKEEARPMTGTVLCFTEEFLGLDGNGWLKQLPVIQNPHNGHELDLTDTDQTFLEEILAKINLEYQLKNTWQNGMLTGYMQVLLIYLSRLYTEQFKNAALFPDRELLTRYLSRINDNYKEYHEVSAYADMLNISAGHLSEVVKEQSGKSAIAHIHERIILEAKRLIFHTNSSVKEIAFDLGFEDASYFNRFFKRLTAQTPVEYKTAIREMYR